MPARKAHDGRETFRGLGAGQHRRRRSHRASPTVHGKKVDPESFKQIRTLGDVVRAVEKLVNEQAASEQ